VHFSVAGQGKVALVERKLSARGAMRVHRKPYGTSHMRAGIPHRFTDGFQTDAMSVLQVYASTDTWRILADAGECGGRGWTRDRKDNFSRNLAVAPTIGIDKG
jgi:hypothetical protein